MFTMDETTFTKIKELKKFVDVVINIACSATACKETSEKIKYLIDNINNPNTYKSWCVCLDIFDYELKTNREKQGVYWRKWAVFFENNLLEIEAASFHNDDPMGHYEADYYYCASIYFETGLKEPKIYMNVDVSDFINDAMNYKNYMTANLNNVEIDMDIWDI